MSLGGISAEENSRSGIELGEDKSGKSHHLKPGQWSDGSIDAVQPIG